MSAFVIRKTPEATKIAIKQKIELYIQNINNLNIINTTKKKLADVLNTNMYKDLSEKLPTEITELEFDAIGPDSILEGSKFGKIGNHDAYIRNMNNIRELCKQYSDVDKLFENRNTKKEPVNTESSEYFTPGAKTPKNRGYRNREDEGDNMGN